MTRAAAILVAAAIALASPAAAFYEKLDGDYTLDMRGYLRLLTYFGRNPDVPVIYPDRSFGIGAGKVRLIVESDLGRHVSLEFNGFQQAAANSADDGTTGSLVNQSASLTASGRYRFEKLRYTWLDEDGLTASMEADRFILKVRGGPVAVSLGRQPVNLSTTLLWSPNDLFQPFSAYSFNTLYKPGVDAASLDIAIGYTAGVTVYGVLGYRPLDKETDFITWDESAALARAFWIVGGYELAVLGGKTAWQYVAGGSFQGEIGPIGVRGEGHAAFPIEDPDTPDDLENTDVYGRAAAGIDHRWANSVHLIGEYLYNGAAATRPAKYLTHVRPKGLGDDPYLARHYAAVSLSGEPHPLVTLNGTGIVNVVDASGLASAYATYSLSDEATFVGGFFIPWGPDPKVREVFGFPVPEMRSEFGLYPIAVYLETRFAF